MQSGLTVPDFEETVKYFEERAPDALPPLPQVGPRGTSPISFRKEDVGQGVHSVSFLSVVPATEKQKQQVVLSDMRTGEVAEIDFTSSPPKFLTLAKVPCPARVSVASLNDDDTNGFLVADLGNYKPGDHDSGAVFWLRPNPDDDSLRTIPIAESLARVADAQAGDVDHDGDIDVVVAEFGWRRTGSVFMLENVGETDGLPNFERREIDPRHGAMQVPFVDLDQDGQLEFFAVYGQEHESVELFKRDSNGKFSPSPIFAAKTPAFGSSGIDIDDADGDGDMDVLYTNGDMLDDYYVRTSHAVHWLENLGNERWEARELAKLPGACRAIWTDLDSDGDRDVVACSLIPAESIQRNPGHEFASLIWLENDGAGNFTQHVLETNNCLHAAVTVVDCDLDTDMDIVVGYFSYDEKDTNARVSIWWNETVK